jgi:hypothetical protein
MADLKRLEEALVNAHKAGDVNSARIIAAEIVSTRDQPPPERTAGDIAKDALITGARGIIGLPQSAAGLADIPFGLAGFGSPVTGALEKAGVRFSDAQKFLGEQYSPAQKEAMRKVKEAKGFLPTLEAGIRNPSVPLAAIGETVPQMLGGAGVAKALLAKGIPAVAAVGAGEGVLGAGSAAAQMREAAPEQGITPKQSLAAIGLGLGTAAIGAGGSALAASKLGQKIGLADIDTLIAKGGTEAAEAANAKVGFIRATATSGLSEGALQEMPQSAQEQMWQNWASDRPLFEGVPEASAMGLLTGTPLGAVGGAYQNLAGRGEPEAVQPPQAAPIPPSAYFDEPSPLENPYGNITAEAMPDVADEINAVRSKNKQSPLDSFSIEDAVNAGLPQERVDSILSSSLERAGISPELQIEPEDVYDAASVSGLDIEQPGFRDFLLRATGSDNPEEMSPVQRVAALGAIQNLPEGVGDLPTGTNARSFTEAQYKAGLKAIKSAPAEGVTREEMIASIQQSGVKDVREAMSVLQTAIREGNVGGVSAPAYAVFDESGNAVGRYNDPQEAGERAERLNGSVTEFAQTRYFPAEAGRAPVAGQQPAAAPREVAPDVAALRQKLAPALKRFGLEGVGLRVVKSIEDGGAGADGAYANKLIQVALSAENPMGVMRHEVIHALKELGAFTAKEWRVLEGKAKSEWVNKFIREAGTYERYQQVYENATGSLEGFDEYINEEAIAEAFKYFDATKVPPGLVGNLFGRIRNLFASLRNALQGAGFQTAEDVLGRIEEGKVMPTQAETSAAPKFSVPTRPEIKQALTRNITGEVIPSTKTEMAQVSEVPMVVKQNLTDEILNSGIVQQMANLLGVRSEVKVTPGTGGYEGSITPNLIVQVFDPNPEVSANDAAKISAAMTYVFKQDAVPYFRADPRLINSDQRGYRITFGSDQLTETQERGIFNALRSIMGDGAGYTKMSGNQMVLINYRGEDGKPFLMDDEAFASAVSQFKDTASDIVNVNNVEKFGVESEYPYHDWKDDAAGAGIIAGLQGRTGGRSDIQNGLDSLRKSFVDSARESVRSAGLEPRFSLSDKRGRLGDPRYGKRVTTDTIEVDGQDRPTRTSKGTLIYPTEEGVKNFWRWFGNSVFVDEDGRPLVMYHGTAADIEEFIPKQANAIFITPQVEFSAEFKGGVLTGVATWSENWMVEHYDEILSPDQIEAAKLEALENIDPETKRDYKLSKKAHHSAFVETSEFMQAIKDQLPSRANVIPLFVKSENPFNYSNENHVRQAVDRLFLDFGVDLEQDPNGRIRFMNEADSMADREYSENEVYNMLTKGYWPLIEQAEIQDVIRDLGFDGFSVQESLVKNYAVFDPNQVKSSVGNDGNFSDKKGIRFSIKDKSFYHVTQTKNADKIRKKGLLPLQKSNWVKSGDKSRYGGGNVFVFENPEDAVRWAAKMDWEFNGKWGSGNISIVEVKPSAKSNWVEDTADPLTQAAYKGKWLKKMEAVPSEDIGRTVEFTKDMLTEGWSGFGKAEPDQTRYSITAPDTPEFKRWFGKSKVVDADGKPLVVYHGTNKDISEFATRQKVPRNRFYAGELGSWFGSDPGVANTFSTGRYAESGAIYPVYLSIKNPREFESYNEFLDFAEGRKSASSVRAELEKEGHDGIVVRNSVTDLSAMRDDWVAFRPEQIKSAVGNRGTFSPKSKDIRYSLAQTKTPEFKRWFGDSKVVDSDGKPLVVYHGTSKDKDFTSFNVGMRGAWFTSSPEEASMYSKENDSQGYKYEGGKFIAKNVASRVMPVYLSIQNPYVLTKDDLEKLKGSNYAEAQRYVFSRARSQGFDGIDLGDGVWVVLKSPTQIKSAVGNRGTFDETKKDIRYSLKDKEQPYTITKDDGKYITVDFDDPENILGISQAKLSHWWTPQADKDIGGRYGMFLIGDNVLSFDQFAITITPFDGGQSKVFRDGDNRSNVIPLADADKYLPKEIAGIVSSAKDGGERDAYKKLVNLILEKTKKPQPRYSLQGGKAFDLDQTTSKDNIIYLLQDDKIDLKRVVDGVYKQGNKIADRWNAYEKEESYYGRSAERIKQFATRDLHPIIKKMDGASISLNEMDDYLLARHAKEANAYLRTINPDPNQNAGMSDAEADAYMKAVPAAKKVVLDRLAKDIDAITKGTRDLMVEYGLEDRKTVDQWAKTYKHYVPLFREETEGQPLSAGRGFSVRGSTSKRRTGSARKVVDVLANIALQREKVIARGEHNRVGNSLYGMVLLNPNPDFWSVIRPEKMTKDKLRTELFKLGVDPKSVDEMVDRPVEKVIDKKTGMVTYKVPPFWKNQNNLLFTRVNGQDRVIAFNKNDERAMRLVTALKGMDAQKQAEVIQSMGTAGDYFRKAINFTGKTTRYFAAINTQYNPAFGIYNLMRDTGGATINLQATPLKGMERKVVSDAMVALKDIYKDLRRAREGLPPKSKWGQVFDDFGLQGGKSGFSELFKDSQDRSESLQNELKKFKEGKIKGKGRALMEWLSDFNEAIENAIRVSVYKNALDKGLSKQKAASLGKNITVNFNRKGSMSKHIQTLYAFFNAAAQGSARIAQTLMTPDGKLTKFGKQFVVGGITLGMMQAVILAMAGIDDDEIPDYIKDKSIVIPYGKGKYFSIPLPLGFHVVPAFGRRAMEFAMSDDKNVGKATISTAMMIADGFNPFGSATFLQTISPTITDPLVALAENKDFNSKPIAIEDVSSMSPTPGYERSSQNALAVTKAIAYGINILSGGTEFKPGDISPTADQIEYLVGQLTGGVGREALKIGRGTESIVTGEELATYNIPIIGRLVGNTQQQAAQRTRFYDNIKTMNQHQAEMEGRLNSNQDVTEYLKKYPEAALAQEADKIYRKISQLRSEKEELKALGEGRESMKRIDDLILELMTGFNELKTSYSKEMKATQ